MKKISILIFTIGYMFQSSAQSTKATAGTIIGNRRDVADTLAFLGWDNTGNAPGALQIRNGFSGQPIDFYTANAFRMRINDNFIFGSATMNDTTGTADDSRMFFNKTKGAFRAGEVTGTYWDADSSGLRSFAAGFNTKAVGNNSAQPSATIHKHQATIR